MQAWDNAAHARSAMTARATPGACATRDLMRAMVDEGDREKTREREGEIER